MTPETTPSQGRQNIIKSVELIDIPESEQHLLNALQEFMAVAQQFSPELLLIMLQEENGHPAGTTASNTGYRGINTWNTALQKPLNDLRKSMQQVVEVTPFTTDCVRKLIEDDFKTPRSAFLQLPFGDGFPILVRVCKTVGLHFSPILERMKYFSPQNDDDNEGPHICFPQHTQLDRANYVLLMDQWIKKSLFGAASPDRIGIKIDFSEVGYIADYDDFGYAARFKPDLSSLSKVWQDAEQCGFILDPESLFSAPNYLLNPRYLFYLSCNLPYQNMGYVLFERVAKAIQLLSHSNDIDTRLMLERVTAETLFGPTGVGMMTCLNRSANKKMILFRDWEQYMKQTTGLSLVKNLMVAKQLGILVPNPCHSQANIGTKIHANEFISIEDLIPLVASLPNFEQTKSFGERVVFLTCKLPTIKFEEMTTRERRILANQYFRYAGTAFQLFLHLLNPSLVIPEQKVPKEIILEFVRFYLQMNMNKILPKILKRVGKEVDQVDEESDIYDDWDQDEPFMSFVQVLEWIEESIQLDLLQTAAKGLDQVMLQGIALSLITHYLQNHFYTNAEKGGGRLNVYEEIVLLRTNGLPRIVRKLSKHTSRTTHNLLRFCESVGINVPYIQFQDYPGDELIAWAKVAVKEHLGHLISETGRITPQIKRLIALLSQYKALTPDDAAAFAGYLPTKLSEKAGYRHNNPMADGKENDFLKELSYMHPKKKVKKARNDYVE